MISTVSLEPPPLLGLVLAGGRSRRMGADKGSIAYRGLPHASFTAGLLGRFCGRVFLSCREDQAGSPGFADRPVIVDAFPGWGPLGGILSALRAHPGAAFLVAACDLPFLEEDTLEELIRGRAAGKAATAFWNPERGKPEPLCAIYEPAFALAAAPLAEGGCLCPTDLLQRLGFQALPLPGGGSLENANSPEDYRKAMAARDPATPGSVRPVAERGGVHA